MNSWIRYYSFLVFCTRTYFEIFFNKGIAAFCCISPGLSLSVVLYMWWMWDYPEDEREERRDGEYSYRCRTAALFYTTHTFKNTHRYTHSITLITRFHKKWAQFWGVMGGCEHFAIHFQWSSGVAKVLLGCFLLAKVNGITSRWGLVEAQWWCQHYKWTLNIGITLLAKSLE